MTSIIDDGYNLCQVRRSRAEKAKTHERIVEVASERIREQGLDRPAVAEIMEAAGLTHGGFYKHFGSRGGRSAAATERAVAKSDRHLHELTDDAQDPLAAFVDWYLSTEHRDDPAGGCVVAALGGDAGRGEGRVRAAYRRQLERYLDNVERFLGGGHGARQDAILTVSALVGAVVLSRAVDDQALSDEILTAVGEGISEG
jgi:TetR/AcrR family transcriptional regulator, transcriptional repressor for nem operon